MLWLFTNYIIHAFWRGLFKFENMCLIFFGNLVKLNEFNYTKVSTNSYCFNTHISFKIYICVDCRVEQTHRSGENFSIGVTIVTYVTKNENGETDKCVFKISGKHLFIFLSFYLLIDWFIRTCFAIIGLNGDLSTIVHTQSCWGVSYMYLNKFHSEVKKTNK